jgi:hypothetical protein
MLPTRDARVTNPCRRKVRRSATTPRRAYFIADGGMKSAVSLHVQFLNDEVVLRFTW